MARLYSTFQAMHPLYPLSVPSTPFPDAAPHEGSAASASAAPAASALPMPLHGAPGAVPSAGLAVPNGMMALPLLNGQWHVAAAAAHWAKAGGATGAALDGNAAMPGDGEARGGPGGTQAAAASNGDDAGNGAPWPHMPGAWLLNYPPGYNVRPGLAATGPEGLGNGILYRDWRRE